MKTVVKKSPIHGLGLFSKEEIRKGELIGSLHGVPAKRNNKFVLWVTEEDDTETPLRITNKYKYANHSSRPNAILEGLDLYAKRKINSGEEITFHYGPDWY
jgi:SET domain-containing protein